MKTTRVITLTTTHKKKKKSHLNEERKSEKMKIYELIDGKERRKSTLTKEGNQARRAKLTPVVKNQPNTIYTFCFFFPNSRAPYIEKKKKKMLTKFFFDDGHLVVGYEI